MRNLVINQSTRLYMQYDWLGTVCVYTLMTLEDRALFLCPKSVRLVNSYKNITCTLLLVQIWDRVHFTVINNAFAVFICSWCTLCIYAFFPTEIAFANWSALSSTDWAHTAPSIIQTTVCGRYSLLNIYYISRAEAVLFLAASCG